MKSWLNKNILKQNIWQSILRRWGKLGLALVIGAILVVIISGGIVLAQLGGVGHQSSSSDIALQKGLVGWWKLNGNTKDSTPYANNGTNYGATLTADREGTANGAMSFNGMSSYISTPYVQNNVTAYTVSAWIKTTSSGGEVITEDRGSGAGHSLTFFIGVGCGGGCGAAGKISFGDDSNAIYIGITSTANVNDGNWHLVAGTWLSGGGSISTSQFNLYIDGQLASTTQTSIGSDSSPLTGLGGMYIGFDSPWNLYFSGSISDVRIYNRVLSSAEVTALYNQYNPSINTDNGESGLIGWWKFNGNTKDSTPLGNNGTLNGTSYTTDREGTANSAITFNGASDYVYAQIGNGTYFGGNNPLSVSAWVYVTSTSNGPIFGVTSSPPGGAWNMPFLSLDGNTVIGWIYNLSQISTTVTTNTWHYLTLTYNPSSSGTTTLYVDGNSVGTATGQYSPSGATDYFTTYISGAKPSGVNAYLNTPIEDVRAYDRVLSPAEITAQYNSYNAQIELGGSGNSGSVSLGKGLVGYWPFAGNAKDVTPYGDNGTVNGATLTTDQLGRANSAYSFNGTSSNIQIPDAPELRLTSAFTISAWVYMTSCSSYPTIVSKTGSSTPQWNYIFEFVSNTCKVNLYSDVINATWATSGNTAVPLNTWTQLAVSYNGSALQFYFDGAADGSTAASGSLSTASWNVQVGQRYDGYYFPGNIDSLRIYNRALSSAEVAALYAEYQ